MLTYNQLEEGLRNALANAANGNQSLRWRLEMACIAVGLATALDDANSLAQAQLVRTALKMEPNGGERSANQSAEREFTVVNDSDGNDTFTVKAPNGNAAACAALEVLGWWVSNSDDDEEPMPPKPQREKCICPGCGNEHDVEPLDNETDEREESK